MARRLVGDEPLYLFVFVSPTLLAVVIDWMLRARVLLDMRAFEYLNYFGSSMAGCGLWGGPLWGLARLHRFRTGVLGIVARTIRGLSFFVILPVLLGFSIAGQLAYWSIFHAYISRDTVRLGVALRGTVWEWLRIWSGSLVIALVLAIFVCLALDRALRKAADATRAAWPILPILGFAGSMVAIVTDHVESRALQAAPPDVCFLHGIVGYVRDHLLHRLGPPRGVTVRTPDPLPPLTQPARRRNVILIITESVRSDVLCSEKGADCEGRFLDASIPERMGLLRLTTQSPGTFSSIMMAWTGLPPTADFQTCHRAAFLWEVARAAGYKTAYISSQNLRYADLNAYISVSGIETKIVGADLGGVADPHLGAPDERATAKMIEYARDANAPYFAVLQLSNTHWPYRTVPELEPNVPHSTKVPLGYDAMEYLNQYKNSVLLQERTIARFYDDLKRLPSFGETVTLFMSDHGEQFREHDLLYHINNLFDEEVHVPGFVVAGNEALTKEERSALAGWRATRVFSQDVHATMLDALGVFDERPKMPFANLLTGRSLLRKPPSSAEPMVLMSTDTGVWFDNDVVHGIIQGERKLVGDRRTTWKCYDVRRDPKEFTALPPTECGGFMLPVAQHAFPDVP